MSVIDEYGFPVAESASEMLRAMRIVNAAKDTNMRAQLEGIMMEDDDPAYKDAFLVDSLRHGIPRSARRRVWLMGSSIASRIKSHQSSYENLCNQLKLNKNLLISAMDMEQIEKDMTRTLRNAVIDRRKETRDSVRNVLCLHCIHNPTEGYTQGLDQIVLMFLLNGLTEEESFWLLQHYTQELFPLSYDKNVIGQRADAEVIEYYFRKTLPQFHSHLERAGTSITQMFLFRALGLFMLDPLPRSSALCIWDNVFCGGAAEFFNAMLQILVYIESKFPAVGQQSPRNNTKFYTIDESGEIMLFFIDTLSMLADMAAILSTPLRRPIDAKSLNFRRTRARMKLLNPTVSQSTISNPSGSSDDDETDY